MRDLEIRRELYRTVLSQHCSDAATRVIDELGICEGQARIDLAVVNGQISGFEIKSEHDTLARLPHQIDMYGRVFDNVTIVCGARYVDRILQIVPDWWAVLAADRGATGICLREIRLGAQNTGIDGLAVAQLLWRAETLAILQHLNRSRGLSSVPRARLWKELVANLPLLELCAVVRDQLKRREDWRAAPSQPRDDDWCLQSAT